MKTPMKAALALAAACAACGDVNMASQAPDAATAAAPDAPPAPSADARATCDPLAPFGAPVKVPGLSSPSLREYIVRMSPDELTAYLEGIAENGTWKLYVTRRATVADPFPAPALLTAVNSTANDFDPSISADGLTLWFGSDRATGVQHLYVATRGSTLAEFGAPALASLVNSGDASATDGQPFVTADGTELWFTSTRAPSAGRDVWRATRVGDGFGTPVAAPELDSPGEDWLPTLSADRLTIYLGSNRGGAGTQGGFDIWRAHRASVDDGFPAPTPVGELDTAGDDLPAWLSPDDCRIYTETDGDVYVATRSL